MGLSWSFLTERQTMKKAANLYFSQIPSFVFLMEKGMNVGNNSEPNEIKLTELKERLKG